MSIICPDYLTIGLEKQYSKVLQQRIADNLLLNPKLKIQAVDFRPWGGNCLGVLVTPWSMELMILSNEGDGWADMAVGSNISFDFPSGPVDFVLEESEGMGRFLNCPLYSPVFDLQDQETAVATAKLVIESLMNKEKQADEPLVSREKVMELFWHSSPLV